MTIRVGSAVARPGSCACVRRPSWPTASQRTTRIVTGNVTGTSGALPDVTGRSACTCGRRVRFRCGVTGPRSDSPTSSAVTGCISRCTGRGALVNLALVNLRRGRPDSVADRRRRPNQPACGNDRRAAAVSRLTCGMLTASLIQVDDTRGYVTLALLVALLAGLAAGVNRVSGLGHGRDDLVAALRATVQLAVVGLVWIVVYGVDQ